MLGAPALFRVGGLAPSGGGGGFTPGAWNDPALHADGLDETLDYGDYADRAAFVSYLAEEDGERAFATKTITDLVTINSSVQVIPGRNSLEIPLNNTGSGVSSQFNYARALVTPLATLWTRVPFRIDPDVPSVGFPEMADSQDENFWMNLYWASNVTDEANIPPDGQGWYYPTYSAGFLPNNTGDSQLTEIRDGETHWCLIRCTNPDGWTGTTGTRPGIQVFIDGVRKFLSAPAYGYPTPALIGFIFHYYKLPIAPGYTGPGGSAYFGFNEFVPELVPGVAPWTGLTGFVP